MTYIIAEAGVNHNGDEQKALELVEIASQSGADAVKFQTFTADSLVVPSAPQADYQIVNTGLREPQREMLRRLELSKHSHRRLVDHCSKLKIEFMSTAFDHDSFNFLVHEIGVNKLKVPSGELTNAPLLLDHARAERELIISTGMATIDDIWRALGVVAYGFLESSREPSNSQDFEEALKAKEARCLLQERVTLLHCSSEYPVSVEDINLRAMDTMAQTFGTAVGYSDHSLGVVVPFAAAAKGAAVIEKHFTADRRLPGPDHQMSLEPAELHQMVDGIRVINKALGHDRKAPSVSEVENARVVRKSIIASRRIPKGTKLSEDDLAIKRPGLGLSPFDYWRVLGAPASKTYESGDLLDE